MTHSSVFRSILFSSDLIVSVLFKNFNSLMNWNTAVVIILGVNGPLFSFLLFDSCAFRF